MLATDVVTSQPINLLPHQWITPPSQATVEAIVVIVAQTLAALAAAAAVAARVAAVALALAPAPAVETVVAQTAVQAVVHGAMVAAQTEEGPHGTVMAVAAQEAMEDLGVTVGQVAIAAGTEMVKKPSPPP